MCVETLGYIPRYMSKTSNNNKVLINNCHAVLHFELYITVTWGIRYIDEGFLIWIILSTYLSYKAVN